ncbi:hypothetical protein KGF56_003929 [Candida oxycetoniae]|uniref:Amino acid transporter transmembrane domain-containing protein n=1 Tax=Candida oxycetoniae TaxID=497107 RepID=A0AAI9WWL1_9ASCO|nr:uncharacterized protein KGF56_003929 [Candida oxycetoniae]KAI3403341.2 hypothetical protein KGF56_003929 [Candida oxycetoniae]
MSSSTYIPKSNQYSAIPQAEEAAEEDIDDTRSANTLIPEPPRDKKTNSRSAQYSKLNTSEEFDFGGEEEEEGRIGEGEGEEIELETLDNLDYEVDIEEEEAASTISTTIIGSSNMKMAFMNMTNSILGAGIIGQPLAFKNSGFLGGILVMILLTMLIDWTLCLIVRNSILAQRAKSYQDTVKYCFGLPGKIVLLLAISSFAYGGCMAFCVIIGDTIPHVLKTFIPQSVTSGGWAWLFHRNTIIVVFTCCISYPLSLNRDISKLAKASAFALFGMLVIVVLTVARAPYVSSDLRGTIAKHEWFINYNIFQGISVISFALVCHHNTMFIYQSMKNPSLAKFTKLTHFSCSISMVFCMIMGLNGFVNFGNLTKGNILNNFKSNDNWINVARFCFGLNMLTTFPLEIFVVRDVIKDILLTRKVKREGVSSASDLELSTKQHFIITSILVFSSMSVSLFTCNLGMILELIGATSASLMAYIIPPMCYYKLSWLQLDWASVTKQERRTFILSKAVPSIACILFGFTVMFISSGMTIRDAILNKDTSDHCVVD